MVFSRMEKAFSVVSRVAARRVRRRLRRARRGPAALRGGLERAVVRETSTRRNGRRGNKSRARREHRADAPRRRRRSRRRRRRRVERPNVFVSARAVRARRRRGDARVFGDERRRALRFRGRARRGPRGKRRRRVLAARRDVFRGNGARDSVRGRQVDEAKTRAAGVVVRGRADGTDGDVRVVGGDAARPRRGGVRGRRAENRKVRGARVARAVLRLESPPRRVRRAGREVSRTQGDRRNRGRKQSTFVAGIDPDCVSAPGHGVGRGVARDSRASRRRAAAVRRARARGERGVWADPSRGVRRVRARVFVVAVICHRRVLIPAGRDARRRARPETAGVLGVHRRSPVAPGPPRADARATQGLDRRARRVRGGERRRGRRGRRGRSRRRRRRVRLARAPPIAAGAERARGKRRAAARRRRSWRARARGVGVSRGGRGEGLRARDGPRV